MAEVRSGVIRVVSTAAAHFRSNPGNGHPLSQSACLKRATFGLLHCGKSAYSITSSACAGNAAHRLSRRGACAHHLVERADRGARYEAHLNEIARNKLDEAATARTCTATKCGKAAPPLQRSVRRGFKARATLP
jgi:hypothetical protein